MSGRWPISDRSAAAPFGRRLLTVAGIDELGAYRVLRVADPDGPAPRPGQFAMLAAAERWGGGQDERPYLARAFSIARFSDGEAHYLLEDVGPGTKRLCELRAGDRLWVLGPLGVGFASPADGRRALLVGGGVGIAPLAIWQDELEGTGGFVGAPAGAESTGAESAGPGSVSGAPTPVATAPTPTTVLLGFRDGTRAQGAALLRDARVATDDGSAGRHGLVTDLLAEELDRDPHTTVYACGPAPMLEAVRAICAERGIPAQLALEAGMACGFGACYGCVVPRRGGGYLRVCVDGPVIDAAELDSVEAHAGGAGGTR
jgi:dihydroorotate dehydrogenase electron transfer subunit